MALPCPWSVPRLPFSRTVRPNSDIVTITVSAIREPRSRVSAASASQVASARRELPGRGALVDVVIPVGRLRERDLEADVGADQLRDLAQGVAERGGGVTGRTGVVAGPRRGAVARRRPARSRCPVDAGGPLQRSHRLEGLPRGGAEQLVGGSGVDVLERRRVARSPCNRERRQARHRQRRGRPCRMRGTGRVSATARSGSRVPPAAPAGSD